MRKPKRHLAKPAGSLAPPLITSAVLPWSLSRDLRVMGLMVALILAILTPMLTLQVRALRSEGVNEDVPRMIAVARHLQSGELPLWDSQTFAGAKPFYADDAAVIYYPLMFPFYFLAHTDDFTNCTLVLIVIPYTLHLLWAASGGYVFARLVMRLHPVGGLVTGLLWGLSPGLMTSFDGLTYVFLLSYLPWIATCVIRYLERGGLWLWAVGVLLGALAISVRGTNYLIREYFVLGMMTALFICFNLRWSKALSWKSATAGGSANGFVERLSSMGWNLRRNLGALAMVIVSIGLNALPLTGVLEGLGWVANSVPMTYETASNLTSESSTPPAYFLSLLIPDFFGVLDARHGWGLALTQGVSAMSLAGGGMCVMTTVLAAMLYWLPRRGSQEQDQTLHTWTWISTILLVLMLLTVMGRYTPAFKWLCAVLPWCFRFPHASYYSFGICWSLAMLAGIGASCFWSVAEFREKMARSWVAGICVALGAVGASFELLQQSPLPTGPGTTMMVPGYRSLLVYGEWGWFLCGPMLYFATVSTILLAGLSLLPPAGRTRLLIVGIVVETLGIAVLMTYMSNVSVQSRAWPDFRSKSVSGRFRTFADYPPFRMAQAIAVRSNSAGVRWVCQLGIFDNQAWGTDGRALLGYSCKPMFPDFERLIKRFTVGWPYRLVLSEARVVLFQNLNVGYLVVVNQPGSSANLERIDELFSLAKFPAPLPYVYTQDRIRILNPEEQLEQLVATDLHEAVFVTPEAAVEVEKLATRKLSVDFGTNFYSLQKSNSVKVDRHRPNSMIVEADVTTPAMLVIAESWHPGWRAALDGRPMALWQVNYLQQGLWLPKGRHRVELTFAPASLRYGAWISAGFGGILLCALVLGWVKRRHPGS